MVEKEEFPQQFTMTLDPELRALIEQLAERERRSLSQQINKILEDWFRADK